jgi:hypothetical protein
MTDLIMEPSMEISEHNEMANRSFDAAINQALEMTDWVMNAVNSDLSVVQARIQNETNSLADLDLEEMLRSYWAMLDSLRGKIVVVSSQSPLRDLRALVMELLTLPSKVQREYELLALLLHFKIEYMETSPSKLVMVSGSLQ